jgi:two-component system chemotaxis response regulator CheB
MVGILLSGANSDGAQGMYSAHKKGAYTIIQDPDEASFEIMPREVLKYYNPDKILSIEMIIKFLCSIQYS